MRKNAQSATWPASSWKVAPEPIWFNCQLNMATKEWTYYIRRRHFGWVFSPAHLQGWFYLAQLNSCTIPCWHILFERSTLANFINQSTLKARVPNSTNLGYGQFDIIETRAADAAFPQAWIFHFMFIHCKETTKNAYVFTFFKRTKFKALYFPLDLCDDVYKRNMKQFICAFATISHLP